MLVVGVTTESSADVAITSVTFAGVAMTHVPSGRAVNNAAAFDAADMWYMANPPLGAGTIVVTVPANAATAGAVGVAISLFGVKPAGPEAVATYGDVAGGNGRFQFTDTNAYQFSQRYYRTLIP